MKCKRHVCDHAIPRARYRPTPSNANPNNISIPSLNVGIGLASVGCVGGAPGPPWSTMTPLVALRSSSPGPPSVIVKVIVLPLTTAVGSVYQWGVVSAEVGPYFQYCVPAGRAEEHTS